MRKITSFLLTFLLMIGTANAQQPATSDAPENGQWAENTTWYFIQFVRSDAYHTNGFLATKGDAYINAEGILLLNGTTKPMGNAGLWCVVGNETDGYKFYNRDMGTGFVLGMSDGLAKMYGTSATDGVSTDFDYTTSTATFTGDLAGASYATYKIHGTANAYWNNSDGTPTCHLGIWDTDQALGDGGSAIQFTAVTEEELAKIDALANVIRPTTITGGQFAEDTQWYRLKIRGSKKVVTDILTEINSNDNNNDNATYTGLFAFTGSVDSGFQIYNAFVGAGKGLTSEGNNNEILTWTEHPSTFMLTQNTDSGYQFRLTGEGTKYINDVGSKLGLWTAGAAAEDGGSTFTFEAVTDMDTVRSAWSAAATAAYDLANSWMQSEGSLVGTNPGYYPQEDVASFEKMLQGLSSEESRTVEMMRTCGQEYRNVYDSYIWPEAGKYYRLISAYSGFHTSQSVRKAIQDNGSGLGWATASEDNTNISQIWTMSPVDGGFALQSVRDDQYPAVQNTQSAAYGMSVQATVTRLARLGSGQFNVQTVGSHSSFHTEGHGGGSGASGNIVAYPGGAGTQSAWYIEEITIDELTIDELALAKMKLRALHDDNVSSFPVVADDADEVIWPGEYNFESVTDKAALFTHAFVLSEGEDLTAINRAIGDIRSYRNLSRTYGNPASVIYEFKAEYGTIMLPGNIALPQGVTAYNCAGADENGVLELTSLITTGFKANVPYIVQGKAGRKYQLIGYNASNNQTNTSGILTGVYEATTAPVGSYVLQNKEGRLGFYKVVEGQAPQVGANRCYVMLPEGNQSGVRALFFDSEATGIGAVEGEDRTDVSAVYDLSGRRVEKMTKGFYVVGGKKVLVK